MDTRFGHRFVLAIWALAIGLAGCAGNSKGKAGIWPFQWEVADTVPGVPSPAERVAEIRRLGKEARRLDAPEQERISRELAAAFPNEDDPLIRIELVRVLGAYPTAVADAALAEATKDSSGKVRVAACEVLGVRGGQSAVTTLSEVLASDVEIDVRLAAARALGATGDAQAVPALGEVLTDRDPEIGRASCRERV